MLYRTVLKPLKQIFSFKTILPKNGRISTMITSALEKFTNVLDHKLLQVTRKIGKIRLRFSSEPRPSSYPYLAGDSFRAIADHLHDETASLDPALVQPGQSIFVCQWRLPDFFKDIHPRIKHQYVLICHNGDRPQIDAAVTDLLDDKVIHFFAQDVLNEHPKVTPIPIGLENRHLCSAGVTSRLDRLRKRLTKYPTTRQNKILFSFSVHTNPTERGPARELFLKHPLMETPTRFLTPRSHNHKLTTYKFVASPPGNSIESCRTWEALYLQTIPIVKNYAAYRHFVAIGLPLWIVNDWHELTTLTSDDLAQRYDELIKRANWEPLQMDYWITQINDAKARATY